MGLGGGAAPGARQTQSLPTADLHPGGSVSDLYLGMTLACSARESHGR